MTIDISGHHLIAGEWSRQGDEVFSSVDPRTGTPGKIRFVNATEPEIHRACVAAREAYSHMRNFPPKQLADFLEVLTSEIETLGVQLIEVADQETALGSQRLESERSRTTGQLQKFAELLHEGSYVDAFIDTAQPHRKPFSRPSIRRLLVPIGPVAVFSASNFPFAFGVLGGDTASAFAAGCPVILKGHPSHPSTSELFAHAVQRAVTRCEFPAGAFSLLQGHQVEVGQALVMHPEIEAVGFTGSLSAGRAIYDAAAARPRPIPVYAEMGSINPVVILPGIVAERGTTLAEELVNSVTLGAGQFCTNPGLILMLDAPETHHFVDRVVQMMATREPGVLLNQHIQHGLAAAVEATLSRPSVRAHTGAHVTSATPYCYANTVLQTSSRTFQEDERLQTEHFGPVTLFVFCESIEDLLDTIDTLHGQLAAAVHASSVEMETAGRLYDRLREKAGRLIWNGFPTGVEVVYAMQHGGPYPATTAPWSTSVGLTALKRFMRPVAFQAVPDALLPDALKDANPLGIWRVVNGNWTCDALA